jgi:transposase
MPKRKLDLRAELKRVNAKVQKRKGKKLVRPTKKTEATPSQSKPQPGDLCPWWKPELASLYSQVPSGAPGLSSSNTACLTSVEGKQRPSSWFSVQTHPLVSSAPGPEAGSSDGPANTTWRSRMAFEPDDVWSAETGAGHKAASARKGKTLAPEPLAQERTLKTMMRLTREQKRILKSWMGAYRFTYNKAVELVRRNRKWVDAKGQYLAEQLVCEKKSGWSTRVNKDSSQEDKDASVAKSANMQAKREWLGVDVGALVKENQWLKDVPSNIRKEAVRDVIKAQASNEEKKKTMPHHRWRLRFKRRVDPSAWSMAIPMIVIRESEVLLRPETRRPRTDGAAHSESRRSWTRVKLAPSTKIGDVWLVEPVPGGAIKKDCRISLDYHRDRFYMCVPHTIEPTPPTAKPLAERKVGAVDPGDRVEATVFSPADGEVISYAVGKNDGGKDRIFRLCADLDRTIANAKRHRATTRPSKQQRAEVAARVATLREMRDAAKADERLDRWERGNRVAVVNGQIERAIEEHHLRVDDGSGLEVQADTPSERRCRRKRMARLRARLRDLVTEAHCKIALDMSRRWDTLILPPFNTHDMVKRPKGGARRIHSSVARSLMNWRHYDFKLRTKTVFLRAGKEIVSPDERYTTMCCGSCGILNDKHSNESWTCKHCGVFHLRDPAASRCIFIKALAPLDNGNGDDKAPGKTQPTNSRLSMKSVEAGGAYGTDDGGSEDGERMLQ